METSGPCRLAVADCIPSVMPDPLVVWCRVEGTGQVLPTPSRFRRVRAARDDPSCVPEFDQTSETIPSFNAHRR